MPEAHGHDQCAFEFSYAQMAKQAGINVPELKHLQDQNCLFFAIKCFDRSDCGTKQKYHQHTLAGPLENGFRDSGIDADLALKLCFNLCHDAGSVRELYRRIVFNYLGHNCDDHAKNISFLMTADGSWRLSPW